MADGVALAHDYVTQRGGAERVALLLADAFPGAPMYTSLYDPAGSFPEFEHIDLRASVLNRAALLRRHHRLALPLLAPATHAQRVDADVLLASSTGWAHGYRGARRTVVYCHAPARWLYQRERYLGPRNGGLSHRGRRLAAAAALGALTPGLRRWDRSAASRADAYLANSTVTQRAIREAYGIDAEVLPPPPALLPTGSERAVEGLEPGFLLCVARLLPYKNVDVVIEAAQQSGRDLAVVGAGPDKARLEDIAKRTPAGRRVRIRLLGRVQDAELRWLYRQCSMLVAASYEDYGLSPLEAGAFGRPSVTLRDGGYLDTVTEGVNGLFFDQARPEQIAAAIERAASTTWSPDAIETHVATFGAVRFKRELQSVVRRQLDS